MIEQLPVFFCGIQISEPYTTLSDLLVSATGFYAWYRVRRLPEEGLFLKYMKWYFLLMGVSTLMGSFFAHAFLHFYGHIQKVPGWLVGMVGMYFLEQASIARSSGHLRIATRSLLQKATLSKLVILLLITLWTHHLNWVGIQSLTALFMVVLPLHYASWRRTAHRTDAFFLAAVACSLLIFLVSGFKWSLHPNFNFNDISHVIMAVCVLLFLKGTLVFVGNGWQHPKEN